LDALRCAGVSKSGGVDAPAASLGEIKRVAGPLSSGPPGCEYLSTSAPNKGSILEGFRMKRIEPGEKRITLKNSRIPTNNEVVKGSQSFFPGESEAFKSV
jgi:hypothetical protein